MLSLILTWIILSMGYAGGFLDLDELKNVYYGIDISDTPLLHPSELPSDAVILSSKYGQLYQCTYPPVPSQTAKENESKANNVSVAELLNPMKQLPCLFLNKGWWTYEFCYGREVKQYHTEDGKIVGDVIILGEYDARNDIINDSQKDDDKHQKAVERYHRHFFVNGTLCDLTGRMREAEVRFVCQEGHGDFVSSVDERETCSYVVTVHTSRICAHPRFGPPATVTSLSILCNPLLSAAEYETYLKEFPADVINKDSAAADDTKDDSNGVVKKLLIESMLKSVQEVLKQREQDRQPDSDSAEVTPSIQTDSVTVSRESGNTAADTFDVDTNEDESDAVDKHSVERSTARIESESILGDSDKANTEADSIDGDDDDDSTVDVDEDESEDFVKEFENEMKDIASTSVQKAHLAKYKDNIASAMHAQFSNILQEAQADMARQGEDVAAVDMDDAYKNLAKTLNLLIERLEKMKTDDADEKSDADSSVSDDDERETSVTEDKHDEHETTRTTGDDGLEQSSADADDKQLEKELSKQHSSDYETSETSGKDASKGEDSVGKTIDKAVPPSLETLRDRLEKAGVRTNERKLDLKVFTVGNNEYTSVQLFSDEDGSPAGQVLIAFIGDDDDAVNEQERNQRLEENYRFKWNKNDNDHR